MEQIRKIRFGNVVQYLDFDKNIKLEKTIDTLEKTLLKNGYKKCHVPTLSSIRVVTDGSNESVQDTYKVIGGDGQVLGLPGDPTMTLLNSLVLKRNENARYFGSTETFSFLKPTNPQNGYFLSVVLTCADGYESDAEMCALGLELAQMVGLSGKLHLGNTAIAQGIVEFYSGKEEKKEKVRNVIAAKYENESDYAASQIFESMKKLSNNPPKDQLRLFAERIENKKSLDGLLSVYEVLNMVESHSIIDKITVDPMYIGTNNQNGTVFYIGEENPFIFGGKTSFSNGQETMNVFTIEIDLFKMGEFLNGVNKTHQNRVDVLVSDSLVAYQRAIKFKEDFLKNNLITNLQYKVQKEEAEKKLEEKKGGEYLVIYIDEKGNIQHN